MAAGISRSLGQALDLVAGGSGAQGTGRPPSALLKRCGRYCRRFSEEVSRPDSLVLSARLLDGISGQYGVEASLQSPPRGMSTLRVTASLAQRANGVGEDIWSIVSSQGI